MRGLRNKISGEFKMINLKGKKKNALGEQIRMGFANYVMRMKDFVLIDQSHE